MIKAKLASVDPPAAQTGLTKKKAEDALKQARKINGKLKTLSSEKRRVLIARDALAQIKLRMLKPAHALYFAVENHNFVTLTLDYREEVSPTKYQCKACALGALFVGQADILAKTLRLDRIERPSMLRSLSPYFHRTQLDLIEEYFESCRNADGSLEYRGRSTANRRMVAILKNIIKNNGTFIPPKAWILSLDVFPRAAYGLDREGRVTCYKKKRA